MQNWAPLIGGCAAGLFALTACSPPPVAPPTATPSNSGQSTTLPSAPATSGPASASPTPPEALATDALSGVACQADAAGVWSFSGTLTNPGPAEVKYTVAVAVGTTSSVTGHAMIEQVVAAGATAVVRADAFAANAPAGAKCEAVVSK
jgi:hypothetical protein